MKRLHAWLAGLAGGAAAYRAFRRTPRPHPQPQAPAADPADELKAKLAEARAAGDDRDEFEAGETTIDAAPDPDVASRRWSVHEQARAAIDEMGAGEQHREQPR